MHALSLHKIFQTVSAICMDASLGDVFGEANLPKWQETVVPPDTENGGAAHSGSAARREMFVWSISKPQKAAKC